MSLGPLVEPRSPQLRQLHRLAPAQGGPLPQPHHPDVWVLRHVRLAGAGGHQEDRAHLWDLPAHVCIRVWSVSGLNKQICICVTVGIYREEQHWKECERLISQTLRSSPVVRKTDMYEKGKRKRLAIVLARSILKLQFRKRYKMNCR